ncbi:hypothetical protein ACWT_1569 [Actinoplanes sp. SE50]|uniref:DUF6879 family protein n=1 Tax=unclassified Actinoplanes TaxID=2626549 RepID=UPI00023EC903|nr:MULTISPECIES: DUF6879 family protein [unclassified Actinoplanes]AEV82588.1 hypothetical protein ACPL_1691 [Actinoplanes sp. SE50/110]ATO80984.1 hypothetical protein ACWT_1569 [Actinoplanes sp. SE50]SLL98391.1 hypothetical protein ACSP50_1617 [Actinoplanes sp. SE50/110]
MNRLSATNGDPGERGVSEVVRKVGVALITGGVAFALTNLAHQDPILSVTLSVLIGGSALVVQFLVDFESRLREVQIGQRDQARQIRECVDERFRAISEATELYGLMEDSMVQTEVLSQLIRHSTRIGPNSSALAHRLAQRELHRMAEFLKELGDGGEAIYDGEDRDWLLGLTCSAEKCIDATSLTTVDGGGMWSTDLGQRYLDAQREAVQRGVRVRRIFILDRPDPQGADRLDEVYRQHADIGVEVRVLDSAAAGQLRRTSLFDFILFDGVIGYEVTTGSWIDESAPPIVVNTRLVLRPSRVEERRDRFSQLWEAARPR